jgi:hypothetical protein
MHEKESISMNSDLVSIYVAVLDNTAKTSERRQTTNDIFVGINSLILTALGFLFVTSHLRAWWTTSAFVLVTLLTFIANILWIRLLNRYNNLLKLRYAYLEGLEHAIEQEGHYQPMRVMISVDRKGQPLSLDTGVGIYSLEAKMNKEYREFLKFGSARLEGYLAYFFIGTYAIFTIAVGILTYLVGQGALPPLAF